MIETKFIDVAWGNKAETCLIWQFVGDWTGQDYFNSLPHLWETMDSKSHPITLLIDMRQSGKSPSNLASLMQSAIRKQPCNVEQIFVVSAGAFWKNLYTIVSRLNPKIANLNIEFVDTMAATNIQLTQLET